MVRNMYLARDFGVGGVAHALTFVVLHLGGQSSELDGSGKQVGCAS